MYQALYRKYRPARFSDVVGQEHITDTLRRQVETGRISHAYLFVGSRGTGKTTCAKILARAINCENPRDGEPCNECAACRGIMDGSILDVAEIDAASNNGVENVRTIRDEAVYSPASVKRRVYIIDEVHMLSGSAFNALLKIMEEPPEHLVFILATTELNKIPATILSRCQRFSFRRLNADDIAGRIEYVAGSENIEVTPGAAALLARLADGAMRDALSLLDQCLTGGAVTEERVLSAVGLAGSRETAELWLSLRRGDIGAALAGFRRIYMNGAEPGSILGELTTLVRDILLVRAAPKSAGALISGAFGVEELKKLGNGADTAALVAASQTLQETTASLSGLKDRRTAAEVALMKLAWTLPGKEIPEFEPVEDLAGKAAASSRTTEAAELAGASPRTTEVALDDTPPWEDMPAASAGERRDEGGAAHKETETAVETVGAGVPDRPPSDGDVPPWEDLPEEEHFDWGDAPTDMAGASPRTTGDYNEPAVAAPGADWWAKTLSLAGDRLGNADKILADAAQISASVSDAKITVLALNGFALMMTNKPEIKSAIAEAAAKVLGKNVTVTITDEDASAGDKAGKLNDLISQFSIKET